MVSHPLKDSAHMPRLTFDVTDAIVGERIDRALAALLQDRSLSRKHAKALVERGLVHHNKRACRRASTKLALGDTISVESNALPKPTAGEDVSAKHPDEPPRQTIITAEHVLFEDDDLIIVNKPSGLPSHATRDPNRPHLLGALTSFLYWRHVDAGQAPIKPYVALHHRLDVDTSGVMALAKSRRANKGLMKVFQERLANKTYIALCASPDKLLPEVVENHLGEERVAKGRVRMIEVRAGGDYARTELKILHSVANIAVIQARPHTGRRHQIRAHLTHVGAPILGDTLYEGPERVRGVRFDRVMLHASALELPHPISGAFVRASVEPDKKWEEALAKLTS